MIITVLCVTVVVYFLIMIVAFIILYADNIMMSDFYTTFEKRDFLAALVFMKYFQDNIDSMIESESALHPDGWKLNAYRYYEMLHKLFIIAYPLWRLLVIILRISRKIFGKEKEK